MEELKPCKCGSVDIHEEVMSDNKSHIACQVCGFEIITDYPEWSFELWNTRAKEVIMSEPLSKVFQFKRKPSPTYFPANEGYNLCLDELDQLSPDVKKLAFIIYKVGMRNLASEDEIKSTFNMHYVTWNPTVNECYVKAQEIINKMNVWIVKESSGQCNHEFMQQYDFSKFSNAGNSLKCVKCGLIKKG